MTRGTSQIAHELLVLSAQSGDRQAVARLVFIWHKPMLRHAIRLMPDEASARDAVQDAWLAIGKSIRRLDDPARFRAWAFCIVGHKCADIARREQRRRSVDRAHVHVDKSDIDESRHADLRRALREIDREGAAMLALHYVDGLGVTELAEVFAVPAGTVKSRLHHARKQLKSRIERMES